MDENIITPARHFILKAAYEVCQFGMLTELPFLSTFLCYLADIAITGNPLYPKFNPYFVGKPCETPLSCDPIEFMNLGMYVNSGSRFRGNISAVGSWRECNNKLIAISTLFAQANYGIYLAELLDKDFPILVYVGDRDYHASW